MQTRHSVVWTPKVDQISRPMKPAMATIVMMRFLCWDMRSPQLDTGSVVFSVTQAR